MTRKSTGPEPSPGDGVRGKTFALLAPLATALQSTAAFILRVAKRMQADRLPQIAGSLTFTTLLALVPLLTIVLSVVSVFPAFDQWIAQLEGFLMRHMLPSAAREVVSEQMGEFTRKAAQLSSVGLVLLAATAIALIATIERALNSVFGVLRPRPFGRRILIYWVGITAGPLLVGVSLSVSSWLIGQSLGSSGQASSALSWLLEPVPILLTTGAFAILYYVVPNRPVQARDALAGGLLAGVAFEFAKHGFALYVTHVPTWKAVYGTLAALPLFLLWLYVSWCVVLGGAAVTAELGESRSRRGRRAGVVGADFRAAIAALRVLVIAHDRGESVDLARFASAPWLDEPTALRLLETMRAAQWVGRLDDGRWTLTIAPEALRVADVLERFAVGRLPEASVDDPVGTRVERYIERVLRARTSENVSLRVLYTPLDPRADARAAKPLTGQ